eukprot:TRINITY_DN68181_c6_g6_i1.p1 TRINITY_DN68181_c6_g6~~TRINITY_DN68181_c6_g6_i1.p1  ORF type:complete len:210 (+),score=24.90 TRINITY_DN68181_c6_g6_i1:91-630(+)
MKMREAVNDPHEGKRKCESTWMIHRIHYEKNRYIYDLYYRKKAISKELYDFCVKHKIVDPALHAKWKKPGYERLCSLVAIRPSDHAFNTTSVCRVPLKDRRDNINPCVMTGCISCASGDGGPIWWDEFDRAQEIAQQGKAKKRRRAKEEEEEEEDPEILERAARLRAIMQKSGELAGAD